MKNLKPSDFTEFPCDSVFQKSEAEQVAVNVMVILKRTGDQWRKLPWSEYKAERKKDRDFGEGEREYFDRVVGHTASPVDAIGFSPTWTKAAKRKTKKGATP